MRLRQNRTFASFLVCLALAAATTCPAVESKLRAALLAARQVSSARIQTLKEEHCNAVALLLDETDTEKQAAAASEIRSNGLDLYYWVEIARNPSLADAHPEWMASIQTHPEWRRFFPNLPALKTNEVVKNYPWVPVLYQETFPVLFERVGRLLEGKPHPSGVFLNDLQGAPSACGCGHHLRRWTTDYGPLKTATRLPNDASARFVLEVQKLSPGANVIPVWTTECEELDKETFCAGVGCFKGTCWREFTAQLAPLAQASPTIAALLPYKSFQRDLDSYGPPSGWIAEGLGLFAKMPLRYQTNGVPPDRLIAVLQGWDVTPQEIQNQLGQAEKTGAAGEVVSYIPIEQTWCPRVFDVKQLVR